MLVKITITILFASLIFVSTFACADAVRDANRLLRVTNLGDRFESMALDQTRKIIRTYTSIVNMSASVALPQSLKNSIAECYAQVYAWELFEPGIAEIFAQNLSEKEIRLLIDFYSSRGLPPMEIETFKNTIAKAGQIERSSIEYIFNNSDSCVERDAELINNFLASQNLDSTEIIRIE
ncbi:MAG: DUF2059 domain-containing protein [Gammaproteobacteria bacterium]|nr:DUF2059 domain-containing protein [Gammaproteobacteria bacterium]